MALQEKQFKLATCYHCGLDCKDEVLYFDEKQFCCDGCKTVYDLLSKGGLCDYYTSDDLEKISGFKPEEQKRFDYLDDAEIIDKLVRKADKIHASVTFYIPKIHCSSCLYLLENLFKLKKGINRSTVNFLKREVNITFNKTILSLKDIVVLLSSIGYEPHITLDQLGEQKQNVTLSNYYKKIAIAFFCFGNMMLLSFPEYLGISHQFESSYRQYFGYLNFILAIPVMFYSAADFFKSAYNSVKMKAVNMDIPIVIGIIAMFLRSSYEVLFLQGGGYFDTLGSLILLMLIGRLFQDKSYYQMSFDRDYKSYFPISVTVFIKGLERSIPLSKLQKGEVLLVRNEELITADCTLLSDVASIDYSFVTGESSPEIRKQGEMIYAGGKLIGNMAKMRVEKEVSHSYLTQLWNDVAFKKEADRSVSTLASKMSKYFTTLVLVIAVVAFVFWAKTDLHRAFNAFTSVLIITCPCALALSSPFALGNALRALSNKNFFIKSPIVIEILAKINSIVFDKTGTLTESSKAQVCFKGGVLNERETRLAKTLLQSSSHPLSKKIFSVLPDINISPTKDYKEWIGAGIEGWIEDTHVKIGSAEFVGANQPFLELSGSKVFVSFDKNVKGVFVVNNAYREGVKKVMKELSKHYDLYLLSGDNDRERSHLVNYFGDQNKMVFNQKPQDKLQFIKSLKEGRKNILMIGDGLNDAGALKQSDVGLVISENTNNFSPACDGIVDASGFNKLPNLMAYSKGVVSVIKWSFFISLLYNAIGIYFSVGGTMSPLVAAVLMPISSVTILLFTTIATRILASRVLND